MPCQKIGCRAKIQRADSGAAGRAARRSSLTVGIFKLLSRFLARRRSVADLAKWLDVPEEQLRDWRAGQPPDPRGRDFYYSGFTIPKNDGGSRTIHAPSEGLKALQRRVLHRLLNPLPIHPAATGFVPGRSIVHNARPHLGQGVVINIDLADFFPSIAAERVRKAFCGLGWNKQAADILTNLCTYEGRLPQGAPTSPAISNLACRRLDARLAALAKKEGGQFTRYADDITVSFPKFGKTKRHKSRSPETAPADDTSRRLLTTIKSILAEEGFKIQMKKKVRVQRPHQRQTATGLVVNHAVNLPREVRRRIRAMQQHERRGTLDAKGKKCLRGWEGLLAMVAHQRGN
jgi:RNA-directed DNA polymerase